MTYEHRLVRYTPLTSIIRGTPQTVEVASDEFSARQGFGAGSYQSTVTDLERRLFQEREIGYFLVFPADVLGMAAVYKLTILGSTSAVGVVNSKGRGQQRYNAGDVISIPDDGVMEELRCTLPATEYARLVEVYDSLNKSDIDLHLVHQNLYEKYEWTFENRNNPQVKPETTIYHNGTRLRIGEKKDLHSGDVVRIGPAIVFGFYHKEKTSAPQSAGDSSGLDTAVKGLARR